MKKFISKKLNLQLPKTRGYLVKASIILKKNLVASNSLKTKIQDFVKERAAIRKKDMEKLSQTIK